MATYERKIPPLGCTDEKVREVLSGRWKILILHYVDSGVTRPGELQRMIPYANRRVLDIQLGQLVEQEILQKETFDEAIPRVEYSLTASGKRLMPILRQLLDWGKTLS